MIKIKKRGIPLFEMGDPESLKRYDAYVKTGELADDQKMLIDFSGFISIEEHKAEIKKMREGLEKKWKLDRKVA